MDLLDEYNPTLPQQQKDQLIHDNFDKLNKAIQFLGVDLLADSHGYNTLAFSTAYVSPAWSQTPFTSSGGLIVVMGNFAFTNGTPGDCILQVLVDGTVINTQSSGMLVGAGFHQVASIPIFYAGFMQAGQHTIAVQAKSSGSTSGILGSTTITSGYYILEARRG